jgi:hypothetical protein
LPNTFWFELRRACCSFSCSFLRYHNIYKISHFIIHPSLINDHIFWETYAHVNGLFAIAQTVSSEVPIVPRPISPAGIDTVAQYSEPQTVCQINFLSRSMLTWYFFMWESTVATSSQSLIRGYYEDVESTVRLWWRRYHRDHAKLECVNFGKKRNVIKKEVAIGHLSPVPTPSSLICSQNAERVPPLQIRADYDNNSAGRSRNARFERQPWRLPPIRFLQKPKSNDRSAPDSSRPSIAFISRIDVHHKKSLDFSR